MKFNSITEKFIFYHIPTLLFSLIPFFLITGPFLSDLSISLISLIFLIYCIKGKDFTFFYNKYFFYFLFFWIYLFFNTFINNNLDNLGSVLVYSRFGIFMVAVVALLNFNSQFIKYFFYCILICFSCLILDGFYQYFSGYNILGWENSSRTSSFFGEEKILGSYLSRLWPIFFAIYILIFKEKNKLFFFLVLIFILSEALIFLSGDRSAFFYINLSAIFVIILSKKLLKLRLFILLSSILTLFVISIINPTAKERVFDHTINQMNLGIDKTKEDQIYIFSMEHTHHYITAYRMFLDNKILGVGLKKFRKYCSDEKYQVSKWSCSTHPHNLYIQILSELGIFGFIYLLLILFYFCKHVLKHLINKFKGRYYFNDFEICVLSGIAIYLWPFIPSGNIFTNWLTIIMIINIPFFIWSRGLIKK